VKLQITLFKNVTNKTFQMHSDAQNFPVRQMILKISLLSVIVISRLSLNIA